MFNNIACDLLEGELKTYYSDDSTVADTHNNNYSKETLNSVSISGLPPHKLRLKKGMPVMLLRNLNPLNGLCNGTRLIIKKMLSRVIQCEISIGEKSGKRVLIPRMPLITTDIKLPYDLKRIQFPLRPAFAMTINKSQGQSLKYVGIWLNEPVFTHGQLYVAMSRVSSINNLVINLNTNTNTTNNVVYKEAL